MDCVFVFGGVQIIWFVLFVDVYEDEQGFELILDIFGVKFEDIQIEVENQILIVQVECCYSWGEGCIVYCVECVYGIFICIFSVFVKYDLIKVEVDFDYGILNLCVFCSEVVQKCFISVCSGGQFVQLKMVEVEQFEFIVQLSVDIVVME